MIRQHGKREQLPKLLYTSPFRSTEYRGPVCITHEDWERMKYLLNRTQIEEDKKSSLRSERFKLHLKSQELMKSWPDAPGNWHVLRQETKKKKEEEEEKSKEELSQEIQKYHDQVKRDTLAHARLQLMCRSHKGRLLTKGILSDAAARERELQLEQKRMQKEFDQMVLESYNKTVLADQELYRRKEKEKKEAKRREGFEYYKDIDKQVAFQKELQARLDDEARLDSEQCKALDDAYNQDIIIRKIDKKRRQKETATGYDKQCEENRIVKKFEEDMELYEDELIHKYIMNKRGIKQSHINFLENQTKLRQDKEDVVFNYIVKANQKKKDEDNSEELRIKQAKVIEDLAIKRENDEKEEFESHLTEFKDRAERQRNIWEKIKAQERVEQCEEHLRTVEDALQEDEREKQVQATRRQFNVDVKKCQYEHLMNNAKRRENEKLKNKLAYKHAHDAHNVYDRDVDIFAQNLIDYAKEQGWPTDHLNHERFVAKWCDHDHMFNRFGRSKPKVSKAIRDAQYKQDVKLGLGN